MLMQTYEGKKLLILGSSTGAIDLIKHAQKNGAYVFVADYLEPEKSPAKQYADEAILMSTGDTDKLEALIREKGIDCVYAGISEFNLIQAMRLAERCNLPFYCNEDQWNTMADKDLFRQLCEKNHVPCPQTYYAGTEVPADLPDTINYPAVVKPVDASSSVGVTICPDKETLLAAIPVAFEASTNGKIIIEQFVKGFEFTAHYTVYNGKATLSCIDNRYPTAVHEGTVTTIPAGRIYPSLFVDEYLNSVNDSLVKMCESLGLEFAVLFVQGMYDPETGDFNIFEGALRGAGECPYRYIEPINDINYATMILDSLMLNGELEGEWPDDPHMKGKSCGVVSYIAKHGTVGKIEGLEETVAALDDVVDFESRYPVGSTTPDGNTLHQLMVRFFLICDDREQMAKDVLYINDHVNVYDTEGESLALKFDPNRLFGLK